MVTLSIALKQLRTELNMKQKDLAEMFGTNVSTVNRWELEKNKPNRLTGMLIMKTAQEKGVSNVCMDALRNALFPREEIKAKINDLRHTEIDHINQLLNDSANGVVVIGIENYEFLYVNNTIAKLAHMPLEDIKEMKCYQLFMNLETPCPFCSKYKSDKEKFSQAEFSSDLTGRHYIIRSKRTMWGGKEALIKYITDITENYLLKQELEHKQEIIKYAAMISNTRVFEYDVKNRRANLITDFNEKDFFPLSYENYPEAVFATGMIPKEYQEEYLRMVNDICEGKSQSEILIKVKDKNGELQWMRYRMRVMKKDENGSPLSAVCSVQVIDQ